MANTTTIPALLIPADLTLPFRTISLPKGDNTLMAMYPEIGCEIVARVNMSKTVDEVIGMPVDLWVDDCGLLTDAPVLNIRASILAGQELYGNAVLTGSTRMHDDITDLQFVRICAANFLERLQKLAEDCALRMIVNGGRA
jgi:hypothetical protein